MDADKRSEARQILEDAVVDAASTLVTEMYSGKNSSDRYKAAEKILQEAGVVDREEREQNSMPSSDVIKLIEVIGNAFGVTSSDVQSARERDVTPVGDSKRAQIGGSLLDKLQGED